MQAANLQSFTYDGRCACGAIEITVQLPHPLGHYCPRQCDCDFCSRQGIRYLSDPAGRLALRCDSRLTIRKQGSEQAEFLACPSCCDVLAATYRSANKRLGALNSQTLDKRSELQIAVAASPKMLSATQKVSRWQQMWLTVSIHRRDGTAYSSG